MRAFARMFPVTALFMFPAVSLAQTVNPAGHWEGSIRWEASEKGPAGEVSMEVDLARGDGGFAGAISIPDYNLKGRPLWGIAIEGRTIRFQIILSAPGDNTFQGSLSADGQSMAGGFSYRGSPLSFGLHRTGDAKIEPPAPSSAIGKELEGTWNGALDVSGKHLRLILTMSNQPGGAAAGTIVAVDQGNLEIPITTITQKAKGLTLDVRAVGGDYAGVWNPETGELTGSWTQGAVAVPLVFRRTAKE